MGDMPTLPVDLYDTTAATAEIGQSFWVTPWSVSVDTAGHMWLAAAAPRHDAPGGTVCVEVVRRHHGVALDIGAARELGHRWSPQARPECGTGVDTTEMWPVVELL